MSLREELAAIEHERWADWQRYMHSKAFPALEEVDGTEGRSAAAGSLVIPRVLVEHWERQIASPYAQLSQREQLEDMKQVDRYWPLIRDAVALGEYLEKEGTSAKELLANLQSGELVIAAKDTIDNSDPTEGGTRSYD